MYPYVVYQIYLYANTPLGVCQVFTLAYPSKKIVVRSTEEKALQFCQKNTLAALLITQGQEIIITHALQPYVWNN